MKILIEENAVLVAQESFKPSYNDNYWIKIAKDYSKNSDCFRSTVGAVIVAGCDIIGTGYNHTPKNQKSCQNLKFCFRDKHKIKSGTRLELCRCAGSHAESNAIIDSKFKNKTIKGSTMYVFGHNEICSMCKGMILNSEIERIVLSNIHGVFEFFPKEDWKNHKIDEINIDKDL
jgi:dCMP deaminase